MRLLLAAIPAVLAAAPAAAETIRIAEDDYGTAYLLDRASIADRVEDGKPLRAAWVAIEYGEQDPYYERFLGHRLQLHIDCPAKTYRLAREEQVDLASVSEEIDRSDSPFQPIEPGTLPEFVQLELCDA